jgi:hypothetical protein
MTIRRFFPVILLTGFWPAWCGGIQDVFKSAELDAMFAHAQPSQDMVVKTNYAIVARSHSGPASGWALHPEADEFWFVRRGSAKLTLGNYSFMMGVLGSGTQQFTANAGTWSASRATKRISWMPPAGGSTTSP